MQKPCWPSSVPGSEVLTEQNPILSGCTGHVIEKASAQCCILSSVLDNNVCPLSSAAETDEDDFQVD